MLITNYSMLEYMLMRPLERPVFDATRAWLEANPDEKFLLIIDEAHLYRGAAGAEVALLLRRLRSRLGITPDRLQVICTSASFASPEYAREFAAQLTGKDVGGLPDRARAGSPSGPRAARRQHRRRRSAGRRAAAGVLRRRGPTRRVPAPCAGSWSTGASRPAPGAVHGRTALRRARQAIAPMGLLVNETMQTGPAGQRTRRARIFPGADARAGRPGRVRAGRARQRRAPLAGRGRPAAVPGSRLLPGPSRAVGVPRPGLPGGRPRRRTRRRARSASCTPSRRRPARCGARVFEFFTCRHCGSAYARAYTDDLAEPRVPVARARRRRSSRRRGSIAELSALDLLLEEPSSGSVEPAELDLVTGRLNPKNSASGPRRLHPPAPRRARPSRETTTTTRTRTSRPTASSSPAACAASSAGFGRSSVQDHQTKGDQPFQALVTRQIEVQPPGAQPYTDFAPLRGRKVLAFSDSRQVAARLAPNLQNYAMRDVIRPLILRGWSELAAQPRWRAQLSLERLYLAAMVGAKRLSVRLRPELRPTESLQALDEVGQAIDDGRPERRPRRPSPNCSC